MIAKAGLAKPWTPAVPRRRGLRLNHPGVISGLHSHALDHAGFNQWAIDDACGQLRMRLLCSYGAAEVGLGHLIAQAAHSAQRGSWRGAGFEATTQGWASLRAARGLLVCSTAREGSYGSAQSTQMDAAEALSQLKAGTELGRRLSEAAEAATAHPLSSHHDGQSVGKLLAQIDPTEQGRHEASVNGQQARKTEGRTPTEPVEAFASPLIVLDTPSAAVFATEAGIAAFSGKDSSLACQGDVHQSAAHTWASVSGKTTSWYVHRGGIQAVAAHGPVSLRAHTDALQLLADQEVTVVSVNAEIRIRAKTKIELVGGQSALTLEGADIEFKTPGRFQAKGSGHAFLGGGGAAAELARLPNTKVMLFDEAFVIKDPQGQPLQVATYRIAASDGSQLGTSEIDGKTIRVSTEASEDLKFELRWHSLVV